MGNDEIYRVITVDKFDASVRIRARLYKLSLTRVNNFCRFM